MPAIIVPAVTRLPDGTRVPFVTRGNADDPAVVFLHGLSDSLHSWDPILDVMPADAYSVAITCRGHGDADRPLTGYHVAQLADDVVAVMTAIGVERAVVVGHSMGAAVAAEVARRDPDRVAGLVLEGAFALPFENEGVVEVAAAVNGFTDPVDREFIDDFQRSTLSGGVPPEFLDQVIAESSKLPAHVWKSAIDGFLAHDHVAGLESIRVPTLLIWGDADLFVPRSDQDLLRSQIARCALEVYAGIGHAVHWECPERFAADVVAFIQSTTSGDYSARA